MKSKFLILSLMGAMAVATTSVAAPASDQTKTKLKVKKIEGEPKKVSDLDKEITNARMRAEEGSQSKWSISADLGYSGSTLETPLAGDRPDPGKEVVRERVSLDGDLRGKYRINKNSSVSAGAGVSVIRPFHSSTKAEVNDPVAGYSYTGKFGSLQSRSYADLTFYTDSEATKVGLQNEVEVGESLVAPVGDTRLTVGTYLSGNYWKYNSVQEGQSDYQLGIYPMAEYALTDHYILRSVMGWQVYRHDRSDRGWTFDKVRVYQTLGLGIVATRDIYLYPYLRFFPTKLRSDETLVSMSAIVNLF